LEEVAVRTGRKVLAEVDNNILLIVRNQKGILDQQLSPRRIHLLNYIHVIYFLLLSYL
jgi:hypothetical protein